MNRYFLVPFLSAFISSASAQNLNYININSQAFNNIINSKTGTLLDVRTSSEFANSHIEGAGQLNYYALNFRQKLLLLPRDQPVYLYCNTGYRSRRAAEILVKNGYKQVYNLEQGIMEWNLSNLPTVVEPNARPDVENKMQPDEFNALIQSDKPVLIDFYAPWCAPCRQMMPMMDSLTTDYKDKITIVKINADASKKLVKELRLASVPYLVLYSKGEKLFDHNGFISRQKLTSVFEIQ